MTEIKIGQLFIINKKTYVFIGASQVDTFELKIGDVILCVDIKKIPNMNTTKEYIFLCNSSLITANIKVPVDSSLYWRNRISPLKF